MRPSSTATSTSRVTELVGRLGAGEPRPDEVARELVPLVYDELRRIAGSYLAHERPGHTLQATDLVHEAWLRLVDRSRVDWRGRSHFRAVAAQAMRRILVDHARRKGAVRHGGGRQRVTLGTSQMPGPSDGANFDDVLAVHQALEALAVLDSRQARVLELRFFAGLSMEEIAEVIGVSKRTVEGEWAHGRAWFRARLAGAEP